MNDKVLNLGLSDEDLRFIRALSGITGWLGDDAAYFTVYMMSFQDAHDIQGTGLEIGVYHGKYLCLLLYCALKRNQWVGGYDIFEQVDPETAWKNAEQLLGSRDRMALWKVDSRELSKET